MATTTVVKKPSSKKPLSSKPKAPKKNPVMIEAGKQSWITRRANLKKKQNHKNNKSAKAKKN